MASNFFSWRIFYTPILHVLDTHKILTYTGDDDTRQQGIVFRKCLSQSDGHGGELNIEHPSKLHKKFQKIPKIWRISFFRKLGREKVSLRLSSSFVLKRKETFLSIHQILLNHGHTDENRPNGVLTNCESTAEKWKNQELLFLPSWNSAPSSLRTLLKQEKEIRVIRRGDKRKCAESFSEIGSIISQQRNEKKGQLWAPLLTPTCCFY